MRIASITAVALTAGVLVLSGCFGSGQDAADEESRTSSPFGPGQGDGELTSFIWKSSTYEGDLAVRFQAPEADDASCSYAVNPSARLYGEHGVYGLLVTVKDGAFSSHSAMRGGHTGAYAGGAHTSTIEQTAYAATIGPTGYWSHSLQGKLGPGDTAYFLVHDLAPTPYSETSMMIDFSCRGPEPVTIQAATDFLLRDSTNMDGGVGVYAEGMASAAQGASLTYTLTGDGGEILAGPPETQAGGAVVGDLEVSGPNGTVTWPMTSQDIYRLAAQAGDYSFDLTRVGVADCSNPTQCPGVPDSLFIAAVGWTPVATPADMDALTAAAM